MGFTGNLAKPSSERRFAQRSKSNVSNELQDSKGSSETKLSQSLRSSDSSFFAVLRTSSEVTCLQSLSLSVFRLGAQA